MRGKEKEKAFMVSESLLFGASKTRQSRVKAA